MKKIIKGKLYDTDTARRLGGDYGGEGFSHWSEELYQKRTGEYFLYGHGGAMTKYAQALSDNSWSGGEKIMPLTFETARQWAEEHLSADTYAKEFGMPEEGEDTAALNIQLDAALMAKLRARAAEDGKSLRATVAALLNKAMGE